MRAGIVLIFCSAYLGRLGVVDVYDQIMPSSLDTGWRLEAIRVR